MRPEINLWRTGNKSQRAFAAHALARIPQRNSPISTRRRRTLWLPLNWRAILKPPAKMPKLQNGTPPPPPVFAVRIGRPRHRKQRSGSAGKLRRWNRSPIFPQCAPSLTMPEPGLPFEQSATVFEAITAPSQPDEQAPDEQPEAPSDPASASRPAAEGPRRRRGRRGGRNRRKGSVTRETPAASTQQDGTGPSSSGAPVSAPP